MHSQIAIRQNKKNVIIKRLPHFPAKKNQLKTTYLIIFVV